MTMELAKTLRNVNHVEDAPLADDDVLKSDEIDEPIDIE